MVNETTPILNNANNTDKTTISSTTNENTSKTNTISFPRENIEPLTRHHFSKFPPTLKIAQFLVDNFQGTGRRCPDNVQMCYNNNNNNMNTNMNMNMNEAKNDTSNTLPFHTTNCGRKVIQDAKEIKTNHIRLITIGPSHYCEKVRWGLDLLESDPSSPIYYTEDAHPPLFHSFHTVPASNGKASMVPMIVFDHSDSKSNSNAKSNANDTKEETDESTSAHIQYDSTPILQKLCPFLYPTFCTTQVEKWEHTFDTRLGPAVRCLFYHEILRPQYNQAFAELASRYTSWIESFLCRRIMAAPLAKGIKRANGVTDETAQSSEDEIRYIFQEVSNVLSDGRQYILEDPAFSKGDDSKDNAAATGDDDDDDDDANNHKTTIGFTAADLTFAALVSPILRPKELLPLQMKCQTHSTTGIPVSSSSRSSNSSNLPLYPPKLLSLQQELSETLAGKHALRMYHQHRFGMSNLDKTSISLLQLQSQSQSQSQSQQLQSISQPISQPNTCKRGSALGFQFVVPKSINRNQMTWKGMGVCACVLATVGGVSVGLWSTVKRHK